MSNLYINGKMVFDDAKVKELADKVEALESSCPRYPNYNAPIVYRNNTSTTDTITVPDDGFVNILVTEFNSDIWIRINGELMDYRAAMSNAQVTRFTGQYFVKKGDTIFVYTQYTSESYGYSRVIFYPYR